MKKVILFLLSSSFLFSCNKKNTREIDHTLNTYIENDVTYMNPHKKQTEEEEMILAFISSSLYESSFDKEGEKYRLQMASSLPKTVDLSSVDDDSISLFYGDKSRVSNGMIYDIKIRDDLRFQDGRKITSDDFISSIDLLLDSKYQNDKASLFSEDYKLVNGKKYNQNKRYVIFPMYDLLKEDKYFKPVDSNYYLSISSSNPLISSLFEEEEDKSIYDLIYRNSFDKDTVYSLALQRAIDASIMFLASSFLSYYDQIRDDGIKRIDDSEKISYLSYYLNNRSFFDKNFDKWERLKNVKNQDLVYNVTYEMIKDAPLININQFDNHIIYVRKNSDQSILSEENRELYSTDKLEQELSLFVRRYSFLSSLENEEYKQLLYCNNKKEYDISFSDVGVRKVDDLTFRLFFENIYTLDEVTKLLTNSFLVDKDKYISMTYENNVRKNTLYNTEKKEYFSSTGPYVIQEIDEEKITLARNENYFEDEKKNQADKIVIYYLADKEIQNLYFLKGMIDYLKYNKYLIDYQNSRYLKRVGTSAHQRLVINSDIDSLISRGKDKTLLANINFRKAIALSIDKEKYSKIENKVNSPSYSLFSDVSIEDKNKNKLYSDSIYYQRRNKEYMSSLYQEEKDEYHYDENLAIFYMSKALEEEINSTSISHVEKGDTLSFNLLLDKNLEDEFYFEKVSFIKQSIENILLKANDYLIDKKVITSEEKFSFELVLDIKGDYKKIVERGDFDLLLIKEECGTDPYSYINSFISEDNLIYEYGIKRDLNSQEISVDIDENGRIDENEKGTYSYFSSLINSTYDDSLIKDVDSTKYSLIHNKRLNIISSLEKNILLRFEAIPLINESESFLISDKINLIYDLRKNYYEEMKYVTFNHTDSYWESYLKEQNNNLSDIYR